MPWLLLLYFENEKAALTLQMALNVERSNNILMMDDNGSVVGFDNNVVWFEEEAYGYAKQKSRRRGMSDDAIEIHRNKGSNFNLSSSKRQICDEFR